jgi:hypothetical protein
MTEKQIEEELKEIFDDFENPEIEESELFGNYKIIIVGNTGYNDNREHSLGDESLEKYAKSKLENTDKFTFSEIELQTPNWLSDTIYVEKIA